MIEHPQELQASDTPDVLAFRATDRRINLVVHEVADDSKALIAHAPCSCFVRHRASAVAGLQQLSGNGSVRVFAG
jgi:hypothetical protein